MQGTMLIKIHPKRIHFGTMKFRTFTEQHQFETLNGSRLANGSVFKEAPWLSEMPILHNRKDCCHNFLLVQLRKPSTVIIVFYYRIVKLANPVACMKVCPLIQQ